MSPANPAPSTSLRTRVERRVMEAGEALSRRRRARKTGVRARRPAAPAPVDAELVRASLGSVFRELGDAHRRYRQRTGNSGTAELRAAARAFKAEPALPALVTVAAFLDELGLLHW